MNVDDKYLIRTEVLRSLDDHNSVVTKLTCGMTCQQVLGFSDEAILGFYEAAQRLLEKQRYDDAADAFFFLTQMAPAVKAFWIGLGHSERLRGQHESAGVAYMMAIGLDQGDKDSYILAVRTWLDAGNLEKALQVLDVALKYASQRKDDLAARDLEQVALACRDWILVQIGGEAKAS